MFPPSLTRGRRRRLPSNSIYPFTLMFNVILFLLLLPVEWTFVDNGGVDDKRGGKSFLVAAADDTAEDKLKAIFIGDIKKLLTHNQEFYNTYGHKDTEVDFAFEEARLAADVIFLYPDIFSNRVQKINARIDDAMKKAKEEEEKNKQMTADGVPVVFFDNYVLLLGMMGGVIRFQE